MADESERVAPSTVAVQVGAHSMSAEPDPAEQEQHDLVAAAIDLTRLYTLWEANNWSAYAIDFTQDKRDWQERLTPLQRRAAQWNYALFLHGEEAVARTLAPFVQAMPTQEQRVFLTTQIVDEARHHVFFSRFLREVVGAGHDLESTLDAVRPELTTGFRQVFGALDRLTDRLRRHPTDRVLLAQAIMLYHIVIEGMLAHPGQHLIRTYVNKMGILPGFAEGINHIARDESRHMAFGMQVLRELVAESPAARRGVLRLLERILPWTLSLFISPELGDDAVRVFDQDLEDVYAFGLRSFISKLRRVGIEPGEVRTLVKIGAASEPLEQARRALILLRAGVFGEAAPLRVDEEIQALLFDGLEQVASMPGAAPLPGPIQWEFTDAPAWYLAPEGGRARAHQGHAAHSVVTLHCSVYDWAQIAGDKLNPTWALLTRKLRISGDTRVALRLPAILGT